jgi:hypothetical protein
VCVALTEHHPIAWSQEPQHKAIERLESCMGIQYNCPMDSQQWIARCSERLHRQWPRIPADQLLELAEQLRLDAERQLEDPELAATKWLQRGIPQSRL